MNAAGFPGWPSVLARVFAGEALSAELAALALGEILSGRAQPSQIAAFAASMRTKGETVEEICGFLDAMRTHGEEVLVDHMVLDTCGTGGDRSGTINVSTIAALVCAGLGVPVCKHGNRAASSLSGSADVLEALGVTIALSPAGVRRCIDTAGIGFCFAPRFHPAMRHAGPVRSELGVPTFFNILGPLSNPAHARHQLVGVGAPELAEKMLGVLEATGAIHAMVVYGHDGLDELSTSAPSTILETYLDTDGRRVRKDAIIDPAALGLATAKREDLLGGDPQHNATRARAILSGEHGPQRDIVVLNAGAALLVAGRAEDLETAMGLAEQALDDGAAAHALELLVETSRAAADEGLV
jgi:anthranilate phosphoribosyltransferase